MSRPLALMAGIAALSGTAGLAALLHPRAIGGALRLPQAEPTLYALRIAGMMLFALGLFLGGFATAFGLARGVA